MKAIQTNYNGLKFRSRIEARWAVFYDVLGIKYEYEAEGFDLGDGILYLPDFWLPQHQVWAEIKGDGSISDKEKEKVEALARETRYPALIFQGGFTSNEEFEWGMPAAFDGWCHSECTMENGDVERYFESTRDAGMSVWKWCLECRAASLLVLPCANCEVVWPDESKRTHTCGCKEVSWYTTSSEIRNAYFAARRIRFEFGETPQRLSQLLCPRCGAKMTLREPGHDQRWKSFYGCSRYPRCKGSRQD